jgi:hypothetical protein
LFYTAQQDALRSRVNSRQKEKKRKAMQRKITIEVNGVEVATTIGCTYSICIWVEFRDQSKSLLPTGYKIIHLRYLPEFPERAIGEKESASIEVLAVAEWLFGVKPTIKQIGESEEEPGDNERFAWWRKFLGISYFKEEPSEKQQPVQLELSFL